jgi:4-carboxymuconolactone decarboxylase
LYFRDAKSHIRSRDRTLVTACALASDDDIGREGEIMAEKQTAGRDRLGELAPTFAHLNDDVLFGEVWSREEELSARDRSLVTIAALFSAGLYPQLKAHLELGKAHGITKQEAVEVVTQLAFYCGWPKAWSTFPLIEEVWGQEE